MATVSTIAIAAKLVRSLDTGLFDITGKPALPAAANADRITLFTAPHDMRVISAHLRQTAGMGAAATLKMQKNPQGAGANLVDMTAATTAATAGVVTSAGLLPIDLAAGDTVDLLVGGGALTAGIVEIDVVAQRK